VCGGGKQKKIETAEYKENKSKTKETAIELRERKKTKGNKWNFKNVFLCCQRKVRIFVR
jgi:hypothetical protein